MREVPDSAQVNVAASPYEAERLTARAGAQMESTSSVESVGVVHDPLRGKRGGRPGAGL